MTRFPRLKHELILMIAIGSLAGLTRGVVWSQTAQSDENRAFVEVTQRPSRERQTRRVALVIGNAAYEVGPSLQNPVNDAHDMASALEKLGFDRVILVTDANQLAMEGAVEDFWAELKNSHAGVFYYAGHGMQLEGENYLIPVDADIDIRADVRSESLALDKVLGRMQAASNKINIIILDACRNNPFVRQWPDSQRGLVQRGLAKTESGEGTLIAYATAPGEVAADGKGRNGTFTAALLKYLATPGQDVVIMLRAVRNKVIGDTKENPQVPWTSSSLTEGFIFNPIPDQTTPNLTGSTNGIEIILPPPPIPLSFQDLMIPAGWMSGRGNPGSLY